MYSIKKTNVEDAEWFEVYTFNEQAQISNLEAGGNLRFSCRWHV